MWRTIILLMCTGLALGGCGSKNYVKNERRDYSQKVVQTIVRRDTVALSQMLADEVNTLENRSTLHTTVELLPRKPLKALVLVEESGKGRDTQFVYRLDYSDESVFALVLVRDQAPHVYVGDFFEVVGLYLAPRSAKELRANSFDLEQLRAGQYLVFLPFAAVSTIALLCFAACLFSPLSWKAKIVWLPCMLVGLPQVNYEWMTGAVGINLLVLQFPIVDVVRIVPWADRVVQLSLPLAAIVFWTRYPDDVWRALRFFRSLPEHLGRTRRPDAKLPEKSGIDQSVD